ncbi:non-ribosomal peptide synthetase [Tupanvirus soda lake]|uniref:Non-ribosomal peptide synthetase n=2 Tax=Tupanvirus TaxID=2094720 RepID=A0A6N1NJ41_9VIRU|nr:non-ribosomal peptide synthetase [Tupanvirus soda lake]QKU34944.1 non-ribosomal peptide synthetase [Tupanvirus soda lake]
MASIERIFSKIAQLYPENIALVHNDQKFTYFEINRRVTQLSNYIKSKLDITITASLENDPKPIAFYLDRGHNILIAMLAILKSGNYYMPLDKKYPEERIKYIVNDIKPILIITDCSKSFEDKNIGVINLNENKNEIDTMTLKDENYIQNVTDNLAYVIYTSGTTGLPKGVMIKQSSLINLMNSAIRILNIPVGYKILQYASIGFDAAGWDIYIGLFVGGTIYMVSDDTMISPIECYQYIKKNNINMATVTPVFLSEFPKEIITSLEILVVMGDMANAKNMEFWCSNTKVYNGYGPTEATIGSTIHQFHPGDNPSNIGKPFDGYQIYLLDDENNPVPNGEIGEICIGGVGVAVGYWQRPELTQKKFVDTKFGRLYKSGDLGKINSDMDIEIMGRKDNQVKINGVRIELEEIENLTMRLDFVSRACVKYDKFLILYYTTESTKNQNILNKKIRKHLSKYLHSAVIPNIYCRVDSFILTPNGKIDKNKLVIPENSRDIVPASNPLEKMAIEIYQKVLGCDEIGLNTNFFEIGGNSMMAYKIALHFQNNHYDISPVHVLKYPVISDLIENLNIKKEIILKKDLDNGIELSPYQMGMWHYQQIYPSDSSYNMYNVYSLRGNISVDSLVGSLNYVMNKNKILNTVIKMVDGIPHQYFDDKLPDIKVESLTQNQIMEQISLDINRPYDMLHEKLTRIRLFQNTCQKDNYILMIIKHDIIIDAYSENIIQNDLCYAYNELVQKKEIKYMKNEYTYHDLVNYIREKFTTNQNTINYWEKHLKNYEELQLPTISTIDTNKQLTMASKNISNLKELEKFANKNNVTLYTVLVTALNILLYRYSHQTDISFGTQVAMRSESKWENLVGFMVSTIIVRNIFNTDIVIGDLLKQIFDTFNETLNHQYITYDTLLKMCGKNVDIMFVFQNMLTKQKLCLYDVDIEPIYFNTTNTPFPITWNVYLKEDTLDIKVNHSNKYDNQLIQDMLDTYAIILGNMVNSSCKKISEINYLSNGSLIGPSMGITQTVDEIIDITCNLYANNIALCYSTDENNYLNKKISYDKLYKKSNTIANILVNEYKIGPGDIIGICIGRGKRFVITMLAILKTGACYVPMDPNYPMDRLKYMIDDCQPKYIIANPTHKIVSCYDSIISIKNLVESDYEHMELKKIHNPESLAYIIYTSGSTGKPKACMIKHKSIVNVLYHFRNLLHVNETDKIWSLTSISFDIFVLETLLPLISGAQLLLCPQCVSSNPVSLINWINNEKPTILQATPTQLSIIDKHIIPNPFLKILVGGEAVTTKLVISLKNITPQIYNVYGPSETTIWSTCKEIKEYDNNVSIGKPISNTQCLVVNNFHQQVPRGTIGELLIGGIGVSSGYLHKPELTANKFVDINGSIFYKTGDLVKVNFDGDLEYIGRSDHQIKIRGHRIELEEITKTLESIDEIKRVQVVTREHNLQIVLVAFFTSSITLNISKILEFARTKLPSFMVPNYIIQIPRFPETLNGKIDTNKLPNPFDSNSGITYVSVTEYVEPRNETEQKLCAIWKQLLALEQISVCECVLNMGATSIMFPIFVNKIKEEFGIVLTIEQFIKNSTVEKCAVVLNNIKLIK